MFLLNVGSRWNLATDVEEVRGAIFLASGNSHVQFTRKAGPELGRVLIDPQLYLAGLNVKQCGKVCGRLATHPWFGVSDCPDFDSDIGIREWQKRANDIAAKNWPGRAPADDDAIEDAARAAIECQLKFGCTHVILPTPLLEEREDAGGTLGAWIDAGLAAAADLEVGQPLLVTVAVSDHTLNAEAFGDGGFLEAVVDQVTARDGIGGVYIVVALTTSPSHPFETRWDPLRAYLHLSNAFREARYATVMLNFADIFGFACTAVGATDVATGESQTRRRLCLNGFRDDGGGIAVPHFYSHRVLGEFTTETELGAIARKNMLRRVFDETRYSEDFVEHLAGGGSAADVPAWAESQNNLGMAHRHFVARLAMEGQRLQSLSHKKRSTAIYDHLEEAEASALLIEKRVGKNVGRVAPAGVWRDLLDKY